MVEVTFALLVFVLLAFAFVLLAFVFVLLAFVLALAFFVVLAFEADFDLAFTALG